MLIDLVITWVDDADPEWRERFQHEKDALSSEDITLYNRDSFGLGRFRNRNEAFYAVRSVIKNMPFVRNIYLVTAGQTPGWYNPQAYPQVSIVFHEDIFLNSNDLPTFNSNAIEAHLHRIKGLSELFIYLNDDIFICRETSIEDFFSQGKMIVYVTDELSKKGNTLFLEPSWQSAWKYTNRLLDRYFQKGERPLIAHTPIILSKSLCEMAWRDFRNQLTLTSSRKFRSVDTCLTTAGLFPYYAIYKKVAFPRLVRDSEYLPVSVYDDPNINRLIFDIAQYARPKFLSLLDLTKENNQEVDRQVIDFLEKIFSPPNGSC